MWNNCQFEGCSSLSKGGDYCPKHQPRKICKHYRIIERSVSVPWCDLKQTEVLGVGGCKSCEDKQEITINQPRTEWVKER